MNVRRKETSVDVREIVLRLYQKGKSYAEIGKIVQRSRYTIASIVHRMERDGRVANGRRTGRPPILTQREQRILLKNTRLHPRKSAAAVAGELALAAGKSVHPENVRRVLRKNGYHGRKPRRKPFISLINQEKRLTFAHTYVCMYLHNDNSFWERVLFTDESKFTIYDSEKRGYVWRKQNAALQKDNLCGTMKHGGSGVLVWGCMSASGVGDLVFIDGKMDQRLYLNILQHHLQPSVQRLGLPDNWIFQQDNDPKHTALTVKTWLLYRVPRQLRSPPQSADLNPIEHLWDELDRRIRLPHVRSRITSVATLKTALREAWDEIPRDVTSNSVFSMQRRLQAVLEAHGGPTKY